jgi:hypothetical protein
MSASISDDFIGLSDFELKNKLKALKKDLKKSGENWRDSANKRTRESGLYLETEMCYIQRELDWREGRIKRHAEYLKNLNN